MESRVAYGKEEESENENGECQYEEGERWNRWLLFAIAFLPLHKGCVGILHAATGNVVGERRHVLW